MRDDGPLPNTTPPRRFHVPGRVNQLNEVPRDRSSPPRVLVYAMTTIRVAKRDRYTSVDRRTVNDDRLSFRARGILIWLLDKPDDWRCDSDQIAAAAKEGRDAVRTALNELAAAGYIVRHKDRDERGQWATWTEVHERPVTGDGKPGVGESGALTKTVTEDCVPSPSETADTEARAITTKYWAAVEAETGKKPVGLRFMQLVKLLVPFLIAGWTAEQVEVAVGRVRAGRRPMTRQVIEEFLDGRADGGTVIRPDWKERAKQRSAARRAEGTQT